MQDALGGRRLDRASLVEALRRRVTRAMRRVALVGVPWRVPASRSAPGVRRADASADAAAALALATAVIERDGRAGKLDAAALAGQYRRLQDALENSLLRNPALRPPIEARKGAQSKQFMLQLVPYVHAWMSRSPKGTSFSVLDVGPGTGHGSNLLGSLYAATAELGYTARVTTLDTNRVYEPYLRLFCRYISPQFGNIHVHRETYDIVISSHVIEHVWEPPLEFARRLQELARGVVILCAPYREPANHLTEGHRQILDDEFLAALDAKRVDLVESPAWGWFQEPRYRMFIAVLPGTAGGARE